MPLSQPLPHPGCHLCTGRNDCIIGRIPSQTRQHIETYIVGRIFNKGDVLLEQGSISSTFRVVKLGLSMLYRHGYDGHRLPVALSGHGQILGSNALLEHAASLSAVAVQPGRVCEIPINTLHDLHVLDPEFLRQLALSYIQTNDHLAEWARIMRIRGIVNQVAAMLLQLSVLQRSSIVRLPSQSTLAALLATTRETVARALRQLEDQQAILRRDRWHCDIHKGTLQSISQTAFSTEKPMESPLEYGH